MNCNDCCYNLPKDGYSYCTYEDGECIKISMLEKENAELKRIVKMVAMINKDIYTEEGIKAIYAEAEQFINSEVEK